MAGVPSLPAQPPPVDSGNQLLAETPAQLTVALVGTPDGQRMALTIRTGMSVSGLVAAGT
jgi:hypothetical protein